MGWEMAAIGWVVVGDGRRVAWMGWEVAGVG